MVRWFSSLKRRFRCSERIFEINFVASIDCLRSKFQNADNCVNFTAWFKSVFWTFLTYLTSSTVQIRQRSKYIPVVRDITNFVWPDDTLIVTHYIFNKSKMRKQTGTSMCWCIILFSSPYCCIWILLLHYDRLITLWIPITFHVVWLVTATSLSWYSCLRNPTIKPSFSLNLWYQLDLLLGLCYYTRLKAESTSSGFLKLKTVIVLSGC